MSTGDLYSFREYNPAIFDRIFLFSSNYGCSIEQYNEFKYLPRSAKPGVNTHPLPAPATGLGKEGSWKPTYINGKQVPKSAHRQCRPVLQLLALLPRCLRHSAARHHWQLWTVSVPQVVVEEISVLSYLNR